MERILKDKSKLNLSLDIIMLLLIMAIAGIGFLMKYVLIPGFQKNVLYGKHVDLVLWGLPRHQWGTIHLVLSIAFLVLLILHFLLHWNMIVCIFKRMITHKSLRIAFAGMLTVIIILFISFPLFVEPEIIDKIPMHKNRNSRNNNSDSAFNNTSELSTSADTKVYDVNGSQTLQFVADKYNVPVSTITADLKIPVTLAGEKLGRLRKSYLFTMDDVRNSISNYKKNVK